MAKAELKTKLTKKSVEKFLKGVSPEEKQKDCFAVLEIFKKVTGHEPKMWGDSIIGFGNYHYKYESGREGDFFITGFSPRKNNLSIYIMAGFEDYGDLLTKLGKHKTARACLYINKLEDINIPVFNELIKRAFKKKSCKTVL